MKKLLPLLAAAGLLAFGSLAQAQQMRMGSAYGELGVSRFDVTGIGSAKPTVLRGIVGAEMHPYVAVEGMLGFGINEDDSSIGGVPVDVEVKHTWGLFAKPKFNFGDRAEVFGRLGFAHTKIEASGVGLNRTTSEGDFAYGVGANFNFSPRTYVGLDWMRYLDKDNVKADGVTLSVGMKF